MNKDHQLNRADFKLKTSCRSQYEFQSRCLDDLVPEDHKVRLVWDFVSSMDLSACLRDISTFQGNSGRSAVDPRIMLTLWIYSIMDGNTSARKLEELCTNHDVYKWICGGVSTNRTCLAEFRSNNPRKFDELLTKCLAVMIKSDLISDRDFSQDGTRIKANAGSNSFRREDSLKQLEAELTEYIKRLRKEEETIPGVYEKRKIAEKKRFAIEKQNRVKEALVALNEARCDKVANSEKTRNVVTEESLHDVRASTTDPEVRKMKMGDGGYRLAYNVQFATGLDSRVIYGVDVVKTLDPGTAPRMIAQVMERLTKLKVNGIKNWIADAAYSGKNDLITIATFFKECCFYAPPKPKKGEDPKKYKKGDCEVIKKWRDMIGTEQSNELYKKRCSTAEFSNMQIKNRGLREFSVRGLVKTRGMALLHAIAMNVVRFLDLLEKKLKSPIF